MTLSLVRFQLLAMRTMPFHSPPKASLASLALSKWIFGLVSVQPLLVAGVGDFVMI